MFKLIYFLMTVCGFAIAVVFMDHAFSLNLGTDTLLKMVHQKTDAILAPTEERKHPQEVSESSATPPTPRTVKIEGKLYTYNPRNVYNVNGVPTYYDPSANRKAFVETTGDAARIVERMVDKAPMAVYTPQGVSATMEGAKDAGRLMQRKNKALEDLDRQTDPIRE
ncbi:MAG: hypothetical protein KF799_05090 [Bdellovibrionales bacterium]|nr:hypothetical protein [Bdellovibrionales bacterium]